MSSIVLVAGATGRFGGICATLVDRGHRVRALTREPTAPAARKLAALGAEVVPGDYDHPGSLRAAMTGVDSVFASGTMHRAGPDGELRHGRNLAEAAHAAGVPHLVYVSGAGARPGTGVPVLEVKAAVEQHLGSLAVPHTIVAPAYLMENLFNPWNLGALRAGQVRTFVPATRKLQQIPVCDVTDFAVRTLEDPDRFVGRRIDIASDDLSAQEMAEILGGVTNRPFTIDQANPQDAGPGLASLFRWLDRSDASIDIDRVRREHPDVHWHTFEQWALDTDVPMTRT
jgi:uncharacterized protein YbjT (DUF2867 family)